MESSNAFSRIRQTLFSKKVGVFLVCLALSAILWIVHTLNINYKYNLSIPVKFVNLPVNKIIIGELPEKLQLEIKASGLKLFFISLQNSFNEVVIDFNSLKTNEKNQAYSISNGTINLKSALKFDVEILKIRPDTLFFTSNKENSKQVPVRANLQADFRNGYSMVSKVNVVPSYITISGDSSELKLIDTVYTDLLKLNDIHQNVSSLVAINKTSNTTHYETKDIQINFTVDKLAEATIDVPIFIMNKGTEKKITLLPGTVTITYLVAMKDYDNILKSSFKASVNYNGIEEKKQLLKVELTRVPSDIKILNIKPAEVSYLIYNQ